MDMTCKHLPECGFLEKISGIMPLTTKMVKQTCCVDKNRCVMNRMASTMIVHIEDDNLPDEK